MRAGAQDESLSQQGRGWGEVISGGAVVRTLGLERTALRAMAAPALQNRREVSGEDVVVHRPRLHRAHYPFAVDEER